jgi:hypothetical protein
MSLRYFLVVLTFIFLSIGEQSHASDYNFFHEFKIWLWNDSFQVQVIDSVTNSTAVIFVKYQVESSKENKNEKYPIIQLEVDTESVDGQPIGVSIKILETDLTAIVKALCGINLLNTVAINFYGSRDYDYNYETTNWPEPVFLRKESGDFDFLNKKPPPSLMEVDIYRFHKLIEKVLSSENLAGLRENIISDVDMMCSGFLK